MSYTVGVKRRFWFGFDEYNVNAHGFEGGRFILNLVDGSQIHVPTFHTPRLKVYANFWIHLAQEKAKAPVFEQPRVSRPVQVEAPVEFAPPSQVEPQRVNESVQQAPPPVAPWMRNHTSEAEKKAAQRVQEILDGEPDNGLAARSH